MNTKNLETDYSREIFDSYFESGKILRIKLKDQTILEGILVSFFHGEEENDPYIAKWDFVKEADITEYQWEKSMEEIFPGIIKIKQSDIEKVSFKDA